ncbi:hypothetical protein HLH12_12290 [Acinetobacter sp. NIPH 2377]|uniref:hypothetical protein n=1 Tax=Acinetobacter terrestris TaxID=2529843 RepID=UPI0014905758|nr:hypothetical protein [Acinetobacter terrestris]NNH36300.1 hypothetical protein [Acinetobacter terrestris]
MKAILVTFLGITFTACSTTPTTNTQNNIISESKVIAAQQAWCKSLLDISSTYDQSGKQAANDLASQVIDTAYFYQDGPVLFKPTLTTNPQTARTTKEGALSYFVGGNPNFPSDKGFALAGWEKCEVDNAAINISGDSATSLGKVHFTNKNGEVTTVDKTWKFVKDNAGKLRIVVHHSSLENEAK